MLILIMAIINHYLIRPKKLEKLDMALQEIAQSLLQFYQDSPWKDKGKNWSLIQHSCQDITFQFMVSSRLICFNYPDKLSSAAKESLIKVDNLLKRSKTGSFLARVIASQRGLLSDDNLKSQIKNKQFKQGKDIKWQNIHIHHKIKAEQYLDFSSGIDSIVRSIVGGDMYAILLEQRLIRSVSKIKIKTNIRSRI